MESQVSGLEQAESPDVNKEVERAFENSSGHGEFYKCFFFSEFSTRVVELEPPCCKKLQKKSLCQDTEGSE